MMIMIMVLTTTTAMNDDFAIIDYNLLSFIVGWYRYPLYPGKGLLQQGVLFTLLLFYLRFLFICLLIFLLPSFFCLNIHSRFQKYLHIDRCVFEF